MTQVQMHALRVPFKMQFNHHSATRNQTESILVTVKTQNGLKGWGEACPRNYVTGESIETCQQFFKSIQQKVQSITTWEELVQTGLWVEQNFMGQQAAWCAIEMAWLDVLAQQNRLAMEDFLATQSLFSAAHINSTQPVRTTAVLGLGDSLTEFGQKALKMRLYGFRDFKLKISGDLASDLARIRLLARLGISRTQLRLDANNRWQNLAAALKYLAVVRSKIWAVEEPLQPRDWQGLEQINRDLGLKIILDESLTQASDFAAVQPHLGEWIPNVRISKQGGVLATARLLAQLEFLGKPAILGSHVGETSLLTRAGQVLETRFAANLVAREGGFSKHLLSADPFTPHLSLQIGAKIKRLDPSKVKGWGMFFNGKNLEPYEDKIDA